VKSPQPLYFQSTYKGLKLTLMSRLEAATIGIFSLPIRDWNTFASFNISSTASYFQSTYKGLKRGPSLIRTIASKNFQSTYKGLKLEQSQFFPFHSNHFQSTYKGLKQFSFETFYILQDYFQSTYKGLKPFSNLLKSKKVLIFSLPIRDWNFFIHLFHFFHI